MRSALPQTIRAAIYARVSSERQAQDGTIESQLHALRERVAADGLSLDEELCFIDDGYSGSTLIRPALERLRDQAASGAVDRLYVLAPDRLARRYAYQVLLVDELRRGGVDLVFLNRSLGQGPEDDLLLQVQGVVAEYERAKILERSRRGRLHAARSGRVSALTKAPYGYRYVSKALAGGVARFEVCLPEAEVVRAMFRWVAEERLSISQVALRLTAQGVPSPRGRTFWDRSTVWGMLRNPAYKGVAGVGKRQIGPPLPRLRPPRNGCAQPRRPVSWKRTAPETWTGVPVSAILDEAVFETVQEQLRENQRRYRLGKAGARYLLQGLVVCTACGYAMVGRRCEGRLYYRCVGNVAHRWSRTRVCQSRSVRGEGLEAAVWADVSALLAEPGRIEEEFQRRLSQEGEENGGPDRRRLEALASRAQRQISKLIDAYSDGLIEKGEFEPRIQSAREQLERVEADLRTEKEREAEIHDLRVVIGHLETFADRVRDGLESADWATQRHLISTLVKRIEVGEEEVRMVYRVQCAPFEVAPSGGHGQDCWRRRRGPRAPRPVAVRRGGPGPEPGPSHSLPRRQPPMR
jgi:site-specific DNA recombinase